MCWPALVCSRRLFFPAVICKPFISFSDRLSQFLNSLLWFILAYKLAKAFVVPLIFWKTLFCIILMLLITSLIHPASLNWESSRRILHSLWTLKSFILVCRWPLIKLLEVSRCCLNSYCKASSCLGSCFASLVIFNFLSHLVPEESQN